MGWTTAAAGHVYLGGVLTDVVTWLGAALVAAVVVLRVRTKRADRRRDRDAG